MCLLQSFNVNISAAATLNTPNSTYILRLSLNGLLCAAPETVQGTTALLTLVVSEDNRSPRGRHRSRQNATEFAPESGRWADGTLVRSGSRSCRPGGRERVLERSRLA